MYICYLKKQKNGSPWELGILGIAELRLFCNNCLNKVINTEYRKLFQFILFRIIYIGR